MTSLVRLYNPFNPLERHITPLQPGGAITDYADSGVWDFPTVCFLNGSPVLRRDWHGTVICEDDILSFVRLPAGGGGGGDKNPILTVLSVALIALGTALTAGGLLVGIGAATTAGLAIVGIGGAITAYNSGLLSPPEQPSADTGSNAASPTYTLTGQGNYARLSQAIPVVYGRHRIFPDLMEASWSEYDADGSQFLHQLFCVGAGHHAVSDISIEDSLISNFDEIDAQVVYQRTTGNNITLFDTNIITSIEVVNQELTWDATAMQGDYVGWFVLNPVGSRVNRISVDVFFPRGLASSTTSGRAEFLFDFQRINDDGSDMGPVFTQSISLNQFSITPFGKTFTYTFLGGRYKVRARRTNAPAGNVNAPDTVHWVGLRGRLSTPNQYRNITMLAVKMKATGQLTQVSSRKVNCIATRQIQSYDKATKRWSVNPNPGWIDNMVWVACDILRDTDYGAGFSDDKLDLDDLYDLSLIYRGRQDSFNGIFDRQISMWEAVQHVARCGRAVGIVQNGVFRMVRDRLQTLPLAMFTPSNIVDGSFSINYKMANEDTVDGFEIEFIDAASWAPAFEAQTAAGGTPSNAAHVRLFGCTNRPQAMREALYMARNNIYRRRMIRFTTELEGFIPTFGDLIVLSHDMPSWGSSGIILDVEGQPDKCTIVVSEPLAFEAGKNYYMAFRNRDGKIINGKSYAVSQVSGQAKMATLDKLPAAPDGAWRCNNSGDFTELQFWKQIVNNVPADPLDRIMLDHGPEREHTYYVFGEATTLYQRCVVKSIRPRGDILVEIEAVNEDDRIHTGT